VDIYKISAISLVVFLVIFSILLFRYLDYKTDTWGPLKKLKTFLGNIIKKIDIFDIFGLRMIDKLSDEICEIIEDYEEGKKQIIDVYDRVVDNQLKGLDLKDSELANRRKLINHLEETRIKQKNLIAQLKRELDEESQKNILIEIEKNQGLSVIESFGRDLRTHEIIIKNLKEKVKTLEKRVVQDSTRIKDLQSNVKNKKLSIENLEKDIDTFINQREQCRISALKEIERFHYLSINIISEIKSLIKIHEKQNELILGE